ncbi:MAG: flagellar hook-associated protein FlgL [Phycisphaerae bacterium]
MAISPINVSRVSNNMRTQFVLSSLRQTQRELFLSQSRFSTGRRFLTPSEDPVAAGRALDLTQAIARQEQFTANLRQGDNFLALADGTLVEINDLLIQASVIASQTVSNLTSAGEREAEAELVARIIQQLQDTANRTLSGRYVFGGRQTTQRPFIEALGGVAFMADTGELTIRTDDGTTAAISVPGSLLFGALSAPLTTDVDLTPDLLADTRLEDVSGRDGRPIERGTFVLNEAGGAGVFSVDLTTADTIGDVVTRINDAAAAAGAGVVAELTTTGLTLTPGGSPVSVTDTDGGATSRSLGIRSDQPTTDPIISDSLVPRVTMLTPIDALAHGAGIDLAGGLVIDNGGNEQVVELADAETVQDLVNAINGAGVFVMARINESGTGIDVFNRVSGTALRIGENGGSTASDLGLRTLNGATPLPDLNFGQGVQTVAGSDDLRITAADGSTVDVNLDSAATIGDVIDRMNQAATDAGVSLTVSLATDGNGIQLSDATGGTGDVTVSMLNLSSAAADLGLLAPNAGSGGTGTSGASLVGADVAPTRTEGIFSALIDLERALRGDDTAGITRAGERLDGLRNDVIRIQGAVGARSAAMRDKLGQMESAALTTRQFLSGVQDLDFAQAATKLQALVTQLQANLQTSSNLLSVTLFDFLR